MASDFLRIPVSNRTNRSNGRTNNNMFFKYSRLLVVFIDHSPIAWANRITLESDCV